MSDEELIARLRSLRSHIFGAGTIMLVADRIEALVKENSALKEHVGHMLAEQECGCGYDKPTDVCLGHLPLHRKTVARAEQLEAALREIAADASVPVRTKKKGGIKHKWMYKGWRKIAVERIDIARAALKELK